MAMFEDLDQFVEAATLDLPIGGKIYRIPEADAETLVWAQQQVRNGQAANRGETVDGAQLDDDQADKFFRRLLGDEAYEEMLADNISAAKLKRVASTVLAWIIADKDRALTVWKSGNSPEVQAAEPEAKTPNRASRRAFAAAATTTKSRTRTSGTKASKNTQKKPAATRGMKSSSSGDS